jgi:hypothetical protein
MKHFTLSKLENQNLAQVLVPAKALVIPGWSIPARLGKTGCIIISRHLPAGEKVNPIALLRSKISPGKFPQRQPAWSKPGPYDFHHWRSKPCRG